MKRLIALLLIIPIATATQVTLQNGSVSDVGNLTLTTNFGMIVGTLKFKLGPFYWTPKEIVLLPTNVTVDEFFSNASIYEYLEIPENVTFSTCRTVVYYNPAYGYAFKIYNTQTTTQILNNGTFCGLGYEGTYNVFASY